MSAAEVDARVPKRFEEGRDRALERARARVEAAGGQRSPRQHLGRRWPVGCVALEITQRCNLDCELCNLSESSQALKDLPLAVFFNASVCEANIDAVPAIAAFLLPGGLPLQGAQPDRVCKRPSRNTGSHGLQSGVRPL